MHLTLREVALLPRYDFGTRGTQGQSRPLGMLLSILLHVLLGLLFLVPLRSDFERVLMVGPDRTGSAGGGGGGSGRVAYITLPAPAASARVAVEVTPPNPTPPVTVTPTPVPPPVIPPPVQEEQRSVVPVQAPPTSVGPADSLAGTGPGQGGGVGGGVGGGIGPGTGPGTGPGNGTGAGEGGKGRPATVRHQAMPPLDAPKQLRGKEITVIFSVNVLGRVDKVVFQPPISDGKYASQLREVMLGYRFNPAQDAAGNPVPSLSEQTVTIY